MLLLPDLSMIGYLVNTKAWAYLYNIFHHKGLAIIVYMIGIYLKDITFQLSEIILFAHSSFDRMFVNGLKDEDSFNNTQLGIIGKK